MHGSWGDTSYESWNEAVTVALSGSTGQQVAGRKCDCLHRHMQNDRRCDVSGYSNAVMPLPTGERNERVEQLESDIVDMRAIFHQQLVSGAPGKHAPCLQIAGVWHQRRSAKLRYAGRSNKLKVLHCAVQQGPAWFTAVDLSMHTFVKTEAFTWHAMGFAALQEICVDQLQSANKDLEQLRKKSLQTASSGAG